MKTLTIELPDDVAEDLETEREESGAASLADAAVSALRERFGRPDAAALEADLLRTLNGSKREMTDEVVEEWIAEIERRVDRQAVRRG